MQMRPAQRLVLWLCATVLGFQGSVLARGGLVQCTDARGSARLEWLCAKDAEGHCERTCSPTDDGGHSQDDSQPCDDRPVQSDLRAADRSPVKQGVPLIPLPDCVGSVPACRVVLLGCAARVPAAAAHARGAPPGLSDLRTIVIVV
jgi:hypothetical protein